MWEFGQLYKPLFLSLGFKLTNSLSLEDPIRVAQKKCHAYSLLLKLFPCIAHCVMSAQITVILFQYLAHYSD